MNTSRFFRLSGWALILGTAIFLTALLVEVPISERSVSADRNNYFSRPIDQFLVSLPNLLVPSAMLLLTIGVMGLYQRYGPRASSLGKAGLVASMAGGVLGFATCMADGSFGLTQFILNHVGGWWLGDLAMMALFLLFGGIFIFGIDAVKSRLLPRWNWIPIMAGALFPLRILAGYLQEATTRGWSRWNVNMLIVDIPMLIITAAGLIALGYLLESDTPQEERVVMGLPGTRG